MTQELPSESTGSTDTASALPVTTAGEPEPRSRSALVWVAAAALIIAVLASLYAHYQLNALRRDSARRISELEISSARTNEVATRADAEARAARERAALLEAKLGEEQGQRESLEQLYADLSRGRDDAVLVDVERLITLAAQELAISGNANIALAALQTADARLARLDNARFLPLRRLLARDIERLKATPTVDVTGIALKLDQLANGVDSWPLLAEAKPVAVATTSAKPDTATPSSGTGFWERAIERLRNELGEYRDLIRIRTVDSPEAMLLTQSQQQLIRQQLKLRLFNARQALLSRNDRLYRADLAEAQTLITRFFDVKSAPTTAAINVIKQLAATPLSVDLPQINESVAAVRAARTAPVR